MRVLLSTIGSRGDVQPIVALAERLRECGEQVRVCAPPDFEDWINGLGIPFTPVGPLLRSTAKPGPAPLPTPEQLRQAVAGTVTAQFTAVGEAAEGCDVIVAGGALQIAARSIAEHRGIDYVYASYCPISLPSPHHAPPVHGILGQRPSDGSIDNQTLWTRDADHWNRTWSEPLNTHRANLGLDPVTNVRDHIFTTRPWLAADPALAPWPEPSDLDVVQTGAWILPDQRPLDADLEAFLDAGEPPVYFGFGSMKAPANLAKTMVETARTLGRRAIIATGWADLELPDNGPDCTTVGEVNQQALFRRVAAVVHHGGAGTTTAAARAGVPQVVVPQMYDQHYFAQRVEHLGIGHAHPAAPPTTDSLLSALAPALDTSATAHAFAARVLTDGTTTAARRARCHPFSAGAVRSGASRRTPS